MCGIAGFIDRTGITHDQALWAGTAMGDALAHRGPDDSGFWNDRESGVTFVHRRLAIVDLSAAGHQPMASASGRYVLVLNGEIYNHRALRAEVEAAGWSAGWRGHSDTETLLACIDMFGLQCALPRLVGMFALALFDRETRSVYLARDRIGEKPLYYGQQNGRFFFSSELKAIRAHPAFQPEVNRDAVCLFLRHNYIPAPSSIYQGIHKLRPGCWVELKESAQPLAYWSFDKVVDNGCAAQFTDDEVCVLSRLDKTIGDAVDLQMQADVPLGAFLSGGVDSSLIVAMMQERTGQKVQTFSIGFDDTQFDEAPYAKAVADHIGTDHTELYVSGREAIDVIPSLPSLFDEPFSDSSQIPTYLVSKMARQHVTVSLSGDAGDELFGGYNRYTWGASVSRYLKPAPLALRRLVAGTAKAVSPEGWNRLLAPAMAMLPQRYRQWNPGDKIHKIADILPAADPMSIYLNLISHWKRPEEVVLGASEPPVIRDLMASSGRLPTFTDRMMYLDTLSYLPDDILVKVDRAAMGVSLETRVPFLDHRVVEMAWHLPAHYKIRDGAGKWCLRQLLYRRVPQELIERPKSGFGVPLASWLRNDLRDWAESLLDPSRLAQAGYLDPKQIRITWDEHLSGRRNWHYYLWDILMFEAWRNEVGL